MVNRNRKVCKKDVQILQYSKNANWFKSSIKWSNTWHRDHFHFLEILPILGSCTPPLLLVFRPGHWLLLLSLLWLLLLIQSWSCCGSARASLPISSITSILCLAVDPLFLGQVPHECAETEGGQGIGRVGRKGFIAHSSVSRSDPSAPLSLALRGMLPSPSSLAPTSKPALTPQPQSTLASSARPFREELHGWTV